jgi:phospholipase D
MNKIIKSLLVLVFGIAIGASYRDEINVIITHQLEELGYQGQLESKHNLENTYGNDSEKINTSRVITAPKIDLCFTPPSNCANLITDVIDRAKITIYMQAYGLTHPEIINSLIKANERGVKVRVLLDRSNLTQKYSKIEELKQTGIEVGIDRVSGIAHNKIIIADLYTVVTGSFNFTVSAAKRNVENVLIIQDSNIAHSYLQNWLARKSANQGRVFRK